MELRTYQPADCEAVINLFYETVHTVNARDYTKEQLNVWATGKVDMERWNQSFMEHYTLVAYVAGICAGFGDIDATGYLDRLYVHKDYQRQGIASALCDGLEQKVSAPKIIVHASITAKPFFEKRGYQVVKEQRILRDNVYLTNFVMEKYIDSDAA